jgi:alkyldihydroxyacetonephosphate synthase
MRWPSFGYEGPGRDVEAMRGRVAALLCEAAAQQALAAGAAWVRERYQPPYLRDAPRDAGAPVETLETATFWSNVGALCQAVAEALRTELTRQRTSRVVLCPMSHVYPAGASRHFPVGCAQLDDPVAKWREAKRVASDAIMGARGTVTHHHGVGKPWLMEKIGELGLRVLRAVKAKLDPTGHPQSRRPLAT